MSIGGLVVALCLALTLLLRARAAVLAIVVHAVGRGAPRLAIAGLVVLAAGANANFRSPHRTASGKLIGRPAGLETRADRVAALASRAATVYDL